MEKAPIYVDQTKFLADDFAETRITFDDEAGPADEGEPSLEPIFKEAIRSPVQANNEVQLVYEKIPKDAIKNMMLILDPLPTVVCKGDYTTKEEYQQLQQCWQINTENFSKKILQQMKLLSGKETSSVDANNYWEFTDLCVPLMTQNWKFVEVNDNGVMHMVPFYFVSKIETPYATSNQCNFFYFPSTMGQIIIRIVQWMYKSETGKSFSVFEVEDVNLKADDTKHFREMLFVDKKLQRTFAGKTSDANFSALLSFVDGKTSSVRISKKFSMTLAQALKGSLSGCIFYEDAAQIRPLSLKGDPENFFFGKIQEGEKTTYNGVLTYLTPQGTELKKKFNFDISTRIKKVPYMTFYEGMATDCGLLWVNWTLPAQFAWIVEVYNPRLQLTMFVPHLPIEDIKSKESKLLKLFNDHKKLMNEVRGQVGIYGKGTKREPSSAVVGKLVSGDFESWTKWTSNAFNAYTEDFVRRRSEIILELYAMLKDTLFVTHPQLKEAGYEFKQIVGGIGGTATVASSTGKDKDNTFIEKFWNGRKENRLQANAETYFSSLMEMSDQDFEGIFYNARNVQANTIVIYK